MKVTKGIIWENDQIVCIALGQSNNTKTGNMVQSYILVKDTDPITANRLGLDTLICGNCPHKGTPNPNKPSGNADKRSCYVNLVQGVLKVWKAYKAGKYPLLSEAEIIALGENRMVRIGTYGDGAFVPASVWNLLTSKAQGKTAYTHQGLEQDSFYMQSAESLEQANKAWAQGKRTFRVIPVVTALDTKNEVLCPASKEAGMKTTCNTCGLCDGNKQAKSIAIVAHGTGRGNFKGAI
jgi:hypothetical protein